MSVPQADLSGLSEFDAPDVVAPAFRRFRWGLIAVLVVVAATAAFAGYTVDKTRTHDLRELLRQADALQTRPVDDVLAYFSLHNHLASAARVEPCSAFAIRMTQRFLPKGWRFEPKDVAAIRRGESIADLRVRTGDQGPVHWQC